MILEHGMDTQKEGLHRMSLVLWCILLVYRPWVGGAPRSQRRACGAASSKSRMALVDDVEGVELEVVVLIEPGADKVEEPEAGASLECQGVDHELGDRSLAHGIGFVVKDVDRAASELEEVDVTAEGSLRDKRHSKAELVLEVGNVLGREIDRNFHGYRCSIGGEHETLDGVVP